MKIIVFGTRGIPKIPGGVETHCEYLYSCLALNSNLDITVICRSSYMNNKMLNSYEGVKLKSIYNPQSKLFEAIVHSFLAAMYCVFKKPDIVHIHAIGPNLVTPLVRLFGLKVVMTHHGPDYERKKWNGIQKLALKLGELNGIKFSNKLIAVSREIASMALKKYNRKDAFWIPNGVSKPIVTSSIKYLESKNLQGGKYILAIGRFVPEKGFDYLIKAYKRSEVWKNYKLVIAGDADHETKYSLSLKKLANREGIILTGYIHGEALAEIFSNAKLFVLPSFHEGLPITLLEAMSYNIDILASDIEANKEVNLPANCYFKTGDELALADKIKAKIIYDNQIPSYNMDIYNWTNIAQQTLFVYNSIYY